MTAARAAAICRVPTYAAPSPGYDADLPCYFSLPAQAALEKEADRIRMLAEHYINHRFDLLGSGWVQVAHGVACCGVEGIRYSPGPVVKADAAGAWLIGRINAANVHAVRRLWQQVDQKYRPIDWHLDFKSGWRWSEATRSSDITYADNVGADVKVPWELARMQHLPILAWAHVLDHDRTDGYAREFRNQVLDFLATNPPRFGVNWRCTMDVAIRISNWLVAHDLFRAAGVVFDDFFRSALHRAVFEHADHIANHLEWNQELRGNHYLADIVGLVFAASYLPAGPHTNAWLALGVHELVNEVQLQFGEDGANFEASCTYHRLSAEMVVYATALILGLPPAKRQALRDYDRRLFSGPPVLPPAPMMLYRSPGDERVHPFPPGYLERLSHMARFTADITRPDGQVPQFGDNDSGRFLKLRPEFGADHLKHSDLVAAITSIVAGSVVPDDEDASGWEREVLPKLARGQRLNLTNREDHALRQGPITLCRYPDFGLFIYRTPAYYLAVRCGPNGQNDHGGHAHNDQLSFELTANGIPFIVDPGTYLYTPLPGLRNRFRSTAMHNTLAVPGREQNSWADGAAGLFRMEDRARAAVIECEPRAFLGEHHGFGVPCRRRLRLDATTLAGIDECPLDGPKELWFHLAPGVRREP